MCTYIKCMFIHLSFYLKCLQIKVLFLLEMIIYLCNQKSICVFPLLFEILCCISHATLTYLMLLFTLLLKLAVIFFYIVFFPILKAIKSSYSTLSDFIIEGSLLWMGAAALGRVRGASLNLTVGLCVRVGTEARASPPSLSPAAIHTRHFGGRRSFASTPAWLQLKSGRGGKLSLFLSKARRSLLTPPCKFISLISLLLSFTK